MKKIKLIGKIGGTLGFISLLMVAYLHFKIVPEARYADSESKHLRDMEYDGKQYDGKLLIVKEEALRLEYKAKQRKLMKTQGLQIDWGEYVLLAGAIAFLVSLYPAIKKSKMGQLGAILGIISFFIGAAYGTHMFS